jgi:DNA-binding transcriptional LysR family regulator
MVAQHRAIVVADSSRVTEGSTYGVTGGQTVLAVPSMRAKILAQCNALGVGWLPRHRVGSLLENGTLVEKTMADPREPNILYAGWRGDHDGRALGWWLEQLKKPFLATRLVEGTDRFI